MTQSDRSFVNSFWGAGDGGYAAIQLRIKNSLQTLDEILAFLREKALIEADCSKRLAKFYSHAQIGSAENGTLKVALDTLLDEGRRMVGHQEKLVTQTTQQNYDKLRNFQQMYAKNVGKIEQHMSKLHGRRCELERHCVQSKEKYRANCGQIKALTLVCQTTCGREMEKSSAKLGKAQAQHQSLRRAYLSAVQAYKDISDIWTTDWAIALSNIYQLEIERIQICKLNLFSYCNHVATLCVDWDSAIDNARTCLARVAAPADAHDFAECYGTGNQIFEPPAFVEFMDGHDDVAPGSREARFPDPDYSAILSRTFSTPSGLRTKSPSPKKEAEKQLPPVSQTRISQASGSPKALHTNFLSPDKEKTGQIPSPAQSHSNHVPNLQYSPQNSPRAQNATLLGSPQAKLQKMPSRISNYTAGTDNDVFDRHSCMQNSNGSSDYSNPTNYTGHSARSWASPRVNAPKDVQKEINRRSKDFSELYQTHGPAQVTKPPVPIAKDFSIDFIAQALQDLNAGGDGDIDRFRRSMRAEASQPAARDASMPLPASDYVDDTHETATRYPSITFENRNIGDNAGPLPQTRRLARMSSPSGKPASHIQHLPASKESIDADSLSTVVRNTPKADRHSHRRSLSQSPTKSYMNLSAIVDNVTPVTRSKYVSKAVAKHAYKSRESGELSFHKGWHMYIIHRQEDHWYVCELGENCGSARGSVGLVPYNYIVEGDGVF